MLCIGSSILADAELEFVEIELFELIGQTIIKLNHQLVGWVQPLEEIQLFITVEDDNNLHLRAVAVVYNDSSYLVSFLFPKLYLEALTKMRLIVFQLIDQVIRGEKC